MSLQSEMLNVFFQQKPRAEQKRIPPIVYDALNLRVYNFTACVCFNFSIVDNCENYPRHGHASRVLCTVYCKCLSPLRKKFIRPAI